METNVLTLNGGSLLGNSQLLSVPLPSLEFVPLTASQAVSPLLNLRSAEKAGLERVTSSPVLQSERQVSHNNQPFQQFSEIPLIFSRGERPFAPSLSASTQTLKTEKIALSSQETVLSGAAGITSSTPTLLDYNYSHDGSHGGDDLDGFPAVDPQQIQGVQGTVGESALTSLSNTFFLHSNPTATKTIYLDFDGHLLPANTAWTNSYNNGQAINAPAWSIDGDSSFNDTELARIQNIWQRVAEDYAPFDVNVTTELRDESYLTRSSQSDQIYGTRVLISPISSYFGNYGGIAYVGVFDFVGDYYKPALVFPEKLGPNDEKSIAEAISHEAGHNLGLGHDGTSSQGYYTGHGSGATGWAPIMGVGYYQQLTQWSKGEYSGASNQEDDLAIITTQNGFGYRIDDAGSTALAANDLGLLGTNVENSELIDVSQFGIIERNTDQDWFEFATGEGMVNLTVQSMTQAFINNGSSFTAEYLTPPSGSSNLDIWAGIYAADGTTLVAQSNPVDLLSANFTNLFLNAGTYYLAIDGVGKGDLVTGYSDYGSLGQYAISGTIVAPVVGSGITVSPTSGLTTTEAGGTATFTVVLNTQPTADVTIDIRSNDTTEGTVNISSLTFTASNWNQAQTVTVIGVDDSSVDGSIGYTIITDPASSSDPEYDGLDASDVSVVNEDNDSPTINYFHAISGNLVGGNVDYFIDPTVTGDYTATHNSDNIYQEITEGLISAGRRKTLSGVDYYQWDFGVLAGADSFAVEAFRDANSEGDDFAFEYSTNGGATWTALATVNSSSKQVYQVDLSASPVSGETLVRVIDTNRSPKNFSRETLHVDWLYFQSGSGAASARDSLTGSNGAGILTGKQEFPDIFVLGNGAEPPSDEAGIPELAIDDFNLGKAADYASLASSSGLPGGTEIFSNDGLADISQNVATSGILPTPFN